MGYLIMKPVMALLCLLIAVNMTASQYTTSGLRDAEELSRALIQHFDKLDSARHPRSKSYTEWLQARDYMYEVFKKMGLQTEQQCFNTTVTHDFDDEREVQGCNIIGISRGAVDGLNTLVVGAHYDSSGSVEYTAPLRDNGVGAAVLIEVARSYEESHRWKGWTRNFTIIFVAFDLNTKEQFPESTGKPGSHHFVNSWLLPMLQQKRQALGGAVILDSISTYNMVEHTQTLPADFKTVFPTAFDRIDNGSRKGDYLAAVTTQNTDANKLLSDFAGHYRKDRRRLPYRLQEQSASSLGSGATLSTLNHQASYDFWTAKPNLPAILLTDTGDDRVKPEGEDCTIDCNYIFANKDRMEFIYSTYKALTNTLLDRQATYVGLQSGSGSLQATSVASLLLTAVLARVLL